MNHATTTMLDHALGYAAQGLRIFPVWWITADKTCACRTTPFCKPGQGKHEKCTPEKCEVCHPGKHPITPGGLNDASTDPAKIARWYAAAPLANIGIAVPDGMCVIDVDPRNDGEETFDALQAKHGKLQVTRTVSTGGGGGHFYLRTPVGKALPAKLNAHGGPGIDVQQLGKYVLAPPSNHASGGVYEWVGTPDAPIADAPEWLLALGWQRGERATTTVIDEDESETLPEETIAAVVAQLEPHFTEGRKHAISFSVGGWLKQRNWNQSDIARVVEALPSKNPRARVKDSLDGYRAGKGHGWTELRGLIGEAPAAELDRVTPNPRYEAERSKGVEVAAGAAAGAVTLPEREPLVLVSPMQAPAPANALVRDPWPTIDVAGIFQPLGPIDYVIKALDICVGAPAMIAGYGFSAKSISAQEICMAIAMGDSAFGLFSAKRGRAVYVDREQGPRLTSERFQRLARVRGVDADALGDRLQIVSMPTIGLDSPSVEAFLIEKFTGVTLAVIDSFKAFVPTLDENSSDVRAPLDMLTRVSLMTNCAFLVIHHSRKPNNEQRGGARMSVRGSGAIYDGCSSVLLFNGEPGKQTKVTHEKARNSGVPHDPFTLHVEDVAQGVPGADITYQPRWGVRVLGQLQGAGAPDAKEQEVAEAVAKLGPKVIACLTSQGATRLGEGLRSEMIAESIGVRRTRIDLALAALNKSGSVEFEKAGNAKLWSIRETRPAHTYGPPSGTAMPTYPTAPAPGDGDELMSTLERIAGVS